MNVVCRKSYFGRSFKRAINAIQLDYKSINAYNAPVNFDISRLDYIYKVRRKSWQCQLFNNKYDQTKLTSQMLIRRINQSAISFLLIKQMLIQFEKYGVLF